MRGIKKLCLGVEFFISRTFFPYLFLSFPRKRESRGQGRIVDPYDLLHRLDADQVRQDTELKNLISVGKMGVIIFPNRIPVFAGMTMPIDESGHFSKHNIYDIA